RAMLDTEAALAEAQAAVGLIPAGHAEAIAAVCAEISRFDTPALGQAATAAGNPVVPLVEQLRAAVGGAAADHVHLGVTSQDIIDPSTPTAPTSPTAWATSSAWPCRPCPGTRTGPASANWPGSWASLPRRWPDRPATSRCWPRRRSPRSRRAGPAGVARRPCPTSTIPW